MKSCKGFTLIELITVIIIVAVLSVYVVVRWPAAGVLTLPAQASLLLSHLKHTQYLASIWGVSLRLTITTNGYSVSCVNSPGPAPCDVSPVIDPVTNQVFYVVLQEGLMFATPSVTDFDSLGRPVVGGNIISATPARTFTLVAGATSRNIILNPITGFVAMGF
ncbi:MAG: type II secretion system protein [Gammaproteobacteria bacterium]|nr:type II secretion system protein [Gammaproteobacteria bacterium]